MEELKACPSGLKTRHTPYLATWNDQHESLINPTAQVRCTCGFSGPIRYGQDAVITAKIAWNIRQELNQLDAKTVGQFIYQKLAEGRDGSEKSPIALSEMVCIELGREICQRFGTSNEELKPLDYFDVQTVVGKSINITHTKNYASVDVQRIVKAICARFGTKPSASGEN